MDTPANGDTMTGPTMTGRTIGQAPRKRVSVDRNSRGYTVSATLECFNGEPTAEIMAQVNELMQALEARYPRE